MTDLTEKQKRKLADVISTFISRLLSETPSLKAKIESEGRPKVEIGTCKVILRAISERETESCPPSASPGIADFVDMVLNNIRTAGLPEDKVLNYMRYVLMLRVNDLEEGVVHERDGDTVPDLPKPGR